MYVVVPGTWTPGYSKQHVIIFSNRKLVGRRGPRTDFLKKKQCTSLVRVVFFSMREVEGRGETHCRQTAAHTVLFEKYMSTNRGTGEWKTNPNDSFFEKIENTSRRAARLTRWIDSPGASFVACCRGTYTACSALLLVCKSAYLLRLTKRCFFYD